MKRWLRFVLPVFLVTSFFTTLAIAQPTTLAQGGLTMTGPLACPSTGCAAGQRLNFTVEFNLALYDPTLQPNVQVCLYAPTDWGVILPEINPTGVLTGSTMWELPQVVRGLEHHRLIHHATILGSSTMYGMCLGELRHFMSSRKYIILAV